MRPRAIAAMIAALAVIGLAGCSSDGTEVVDIGADRLVEVATANDAVVLDVRTPEEFAAGHVAGAVNIDVSAPTFADQIAQLPTDATYLVYCRSGNRSAQAAAQMVEAGFVDVYNVDAGLPTLAAAGVPLTQ